MNHKSILIFSAISLLLIKSLVLYAEPLSSSDYQHLQKVRTIHHVLIDMYTHTDQGIASVLGYHFDTFFSENWYGSVAIFGAVGGNRGGYGIAAFGPGYLMPLVSGWEWDTKCLIGSGGGGGLAAGGGLALELQTGLNWRWSPEWAVEVKTGYLTFPSGSFQSPTIQFGFSHQSYRIFLPYELTHL